MSRVSRQARQILLFPIDQQIRERRKKLPNFKACDLRLLIIEAKKNDKVELDDAIILEFRRRINAQLTDLLRSLGIDPSKPNAWERGFRLLAAYHHGAGHLAWYPHRTNRNSATWTSEHDLALLQEVIIARGRGLSQRQAIKMIAADRKKWRLFPYRPKGYFSSGRDQQKREAALWARLEKLIRRARDHSFLEGVLGGPPPPEANTIESVLYDLDMVNSFPTLVKNEDLSKDGDL